MKNILIINGHPNSSSFSFAIAESYRKGALEANANVDTITISELNFNPNLAHGYQKRMALEPDLVEAWEKIEKANHLVWIHPVWWAGLPAITKGFIDRLFLPGMAFRYRENSVWWDKLLKGKSAHIITTLDQPSWYYRLVYGRPSVNQLKKGVLQFCGIKPVRVTYVGIIKSSDEEQRINWLKKIHQMGKQLK
ncbi:NAD(P)H-dependent oxidoreductase [Flavobacterium adhaerens]|uniref:NAD(P)H-dependent oxidoreductase n=1 Tax=Flavobacterium adhaerens TaxID=3149043 RepID=UPI0032B5BAE0